MSSLIHLRSDNEARPCSEPAAPRTTSPKGLWKRAMQLAARLAAHPRANTVARAVLLVSAVCGMSAFGAAAARSSKPPTFHAEAALQVPSVGEEPNLPAPVAIPETTVKVNEASGAESKEGSPGDSPAPGVLPDGRVVLNVASVEELCKLPSVGPTRAKKIIELRQKLGGFKSFRQLLRIRGIGPRTLKKLQPHMVLDPPKQGETSTNIQN